MSLFTTFVALLGAWQLYQVNFQPWALLFWLALSADVVCITYKMWSVGSWLSSICSLDFFRISFILLLSEMNLVCLARDLHLEGGIFRSQVWFFCTGLLYPLYVFSITNLWELCWFVHGCYEFIVQSRTFQGVTCPDMPCKCSKQS